MSLITPESVWNLQKSLAAKAKGNPTYRFYSLYDKICRKDVLRFAYRCCKANGGSPGIDGQTFAQIEEKGLAKWLEGLAEELQQKRYKPGVVKRVWIPKPDGKQRPLGVPRIRDRVVEMAAVLVIEPIFEEDFPEEQYGYRPGRGAHDAVRTIHRWVNQGHGEVVDGDLSGYLDPYSYYTLTAGGWSKSCDWLSKTRMRKPFCFPRLTWTTSSSPRFTRCMMVCRDTPRMRMAWNTVT